MNRCAYVDLSNPLYVDYHDREWGRAEHSDEKLYEMLILESFQAGLSWACVLNKRESFRKAFDNFDVSKVALYGEEKKEELLANKDIIRNRLKINAAVKNSKVFLDIQSEFITFDSYIWHFSEGKTIKEEYTQRVASPLSDEISRDLKKRGMSFVGSTIIYSYLQAIGIINGHGRECDLY